MDDMDEDATSAGSRIVGRGISDFTDSATFKLEPKSENKKSTPLDSSPVTISSSPSPSQLPPGKSHHTTQLSTFISPVPEHVPEWVTVPAMQDAIYESVRSKDGDDDEDDERDEGDDDRKQASAFSFFNRIRGMVSLKKRRYIEDGFDLDLSYILPNIIAMGFPAEGVAGKYRNNMGDVQKFLNQKSPRRYRIYNLCSEIGYDHAKFENRVARFGFPDHNPSSFNMLHDITRDMNKWVTKHDKNLCAVHCKAGKGRTGYVIAAFLLLIGHAKTAKEAIEFFAAKRTFDGNGVTIPSQKRYVCYYERWLKSELVREGKAQAKDLTYLPLEEIYTPSAVPRPLVAVPDSLVVVLRSVVLRGIPYSLTDGDLFWFEIKEAGKHNAMYSTNDIEPEWRLAEDYVLWTGRSNTGMTKCSDDIRFTFFTSIMKDKRHELFHCWLNTRHFVADEGNPENFKVTLPKQFIDHARKDKRNKKYPEMMSLEFNFQLSISCAQSVQTLSSAALVPDDSDPVEVTSSCSMNSSDALLVESSTATQQQSPRSRPVERVAEESDSGSDDDIDEDELQAFHDTK